MKKVLLVLAIVEMLVMPSSLVTCDNIPEHIVINGISINSDSVPEKGLRIPPLKESFLTPGYKNRIEKQEHIYQIPWLSLGLFLVTIYLFRKRGCNYKHQN
ncbi:MAG: hypothetical protein J7K95_04660 [Thermoplasmata archaeon]|nr:hypothetical protein [Thermoplasmata archaeon]